MEKKFRLTCESTVDMPYAYIDGREIGVKFYTYLSDGVEYEDDMERTPGARESFYTMIMSGKIPTTSQINVWSYSEFFRPYLERGEDLLHIAFGSGMTGGVRNAMTAAEQLREEFPDRKIEVIDSYCSSSGYGLLVDEAADLRDAGETLEAVRDRVLSDCRSVHHQFFTVDLTYYRRSGRMSGPTAFLANILNICPIMRLNRDGRIVAYDKVRGKKAAVRRTADTVMSHIRGGEDYDGKLFICHSQCPDDAAALEEALRVRLPKLTDIRTFNIGPIIASHCGPGTVAAFFFGDERPE